MAFFDIEDQFGEVSMVIFPDDFANFRDVLVDGAVLCFTGKYEFKDEDIQFIVESVIPMEKLGMLQNDKVIYVKVDSKGEYDMLEDICGRHKGDHLIKFQYDKKLYKANFMCDASSELIMELESNFGRQSVLLK